MAAFDVQTRGYYRGCTQAFIELCVHTHTHIHIYKEKNFEH